MRGGARLSVDAHSSLYSGGQILSIRFTAIAVPVKSVCITLVVSYHRFIFVSHLFGFTVSCPPGTHLDDTNRCQYCEVGRFNKLSKMTSCIKCPDGTTTNAKGAFDDKHCKIYQLLLH